MKKVNENIDKLVLKLQGISKKELIAKFKSAKKELLQEIDSIRNTDFMKKNII